MTQINMCRLYGFCATEPTRVECTLVHAQNALLNQSQEDLSGKDHSNGWGVATYEAGYPHLERQAWAAHHGECFQRAAAKIYSKTVLAHVRRATVGAPSIANTHPFSSEGWSFAHNGTVPGFNQLKKELLELTSPVRRGQIKGETDSEHVFAYIMSLLDTEPDMLLPDLLRRTVSALENLSGNVAPGKRMGLNIMLTNGHIFAGTRVGRTLYAIERRGVYDCEICGFPHIHHDPAGVYWASIVASEPLTHEAWNEVPDRSVWLADPVAQSLTISPL